MHGNKTLDVQTEKKGKNTIATLKHQTADFEHDGEEKTEIELQAIIQNTKKPYKTHTHLGKHRNTKHQFGVLVS